MKRTFIMGAVLCHTTCFSQLKFVIEDFEGLADGNNGLSQNGLFTYGKIKATIDPKLSNKKNYAGSKAIRIDKNEKMEFGGWGKGVGLNVELDAAIDHLNFYVYQAPGNTSTKMRLSMQEDDDANNVYDKSKDDDWEYFLELDKKGQWELISIPLNKFSDANLGGDGIFNVGYKQGKLLCVVMGFEDLKTDSRQSWTFDFLCLSQGKLPVGSDIFDAPKTSGGVCTIGVWSKEGNLANFVDIATNFEGQFKPASSKKLGVIHFFQPFGGDAGSGENFYPSLERINKVVAEGYVPMITLEDHFISLRPGTAQPNLYSIVEGHYDSFLKSWAQEIKQVKSTVLLRILHEFNGNWYPWCLVNNDKNPALLIKAYQRIHSIFTSLKVENVKFIWCPNSMSVPQEKWNYIMDAYPGDEYVDFVGYDVYNGASKEASVWRTFRKEGMENYFILTKELPQKPLLLCETASRERRVGESSSIPTKADWIKEMAEALETDMSKIKLMCWFNEKETFRVNSSPASEKAFLEYILKNDHFGNGPKYIFPLLKK